MNNELNKNTLVKKKSKRSRDYELEQYFKKSGIKNNKNIQSQKNNRRKYKNGRTSNKFNKVLVNDDMIIETKINENKQVLKNEEVTLVKKKKIINLKIFKKEDKGKNKREIKLDKNKEKKKNIKIVQEPIVDKVKVKENSNNINVKNIIDVKSDVTIKNKENMLNDNLVFATKNKDYKKKRRKKYLRESLIFTLIFLIIDLVLYFTPLEVNVLCLFDIKYLNIIVTIIISMISLFVVSFILNYLISELLLKSKIRKMKKLQKNKGKDIKSKNCSK